jgi:hypothetical protein
MEGRIAFFNRNFPTDYPPELTVKISELERPSSSVQTSL